MDQQSATNEANGSSNPAPVGKEWTWSYSSLELFKSCPKKYQILRHDKIMVEPPGKAAEMGSQVHESIENYLKTGVFTADLLKWEKLLRVVYEEQGECEKEYALNKNLEQVTFKAKDVWCRAIIDWIKIDGTKCKVIDWKTGRVNPSKQLQFYAWMVFTCHPEVEEVEATFHWINHKDHLTETYYRADKDSYFDYFGNTIRSINGSMLSATWPEQKGFHCRWCVVTKEYCSNGRGDF